MSPVGLLMNELIQSVERRQLRRLPPFRVGDRVRVHFQVVEGTRRRTQVFEGVVLKQQGPGARRTLLARPMRRSMRPISSMTSFLISWAI